jgi:hypothetical protein
MKKYLLIPLAICLMNCINVNAQVDLKNTGILYVSVSTDTLYINGNFNNTSAAALTNNGKFYIKQNATNDQASMAVGTGTLYLNGSSAQAVNGTQPFKTYNFVTNNNAGITINNNLSVSGTHTFTAGLIATSATPNYLVYEAGSSYSGDGDSKHVNGWVKKFGSTNFTFPVGDATYERTAGVTNLSASSEINCKYYTATPNIYNLMSPLVEVDSNEYWFLNKVSGGTAQIALNWDNSKAPFYNVLLTDIRVAMYTGGNWVDTGGVASGNTMTTGNIISGTISSFNNRFTFGFKTFPVPLKMISFTGIRQAGTTYLHWITDNEQNVSHFEIQRSENATNYTEIGAVAARNISYQQHYDFEDHLSDHGIAYYRLKSIDYDGKFSYSKIVAVSEREIQSSSFIVLNPVHNAITIFNKTGRDGIFDYKLFNAAGLQLLNGKINIAMNGGTVLPVPGQTASGMYLLELSNEKLVFRQKLLIEK